MKNFTIILLCVAFTGFSLSSYAQLNKIKSKAKSSTGKLLNSKGDDSKESGSAVDFSELESQKMDWTSTFERLEKKWDMISYSEYNQKKSEYSEFYTKFSAAYLTKNKKTHSDTYVKKLISTIDSYYTATLPTEQLNALKAKVNPSFEEDNWSVYPTDRINDIDNVLKEVEGLKGFLTGPDPELTAFENSLIAQKSKIKDYVDGGGLEKRAIEVEKRLVQKRRLHEAAMTDPEIENIVKTKIDKETYGTPLRVVITSRSWEVEKNEYDIPKLKFVKVDIATKKSDGKCYYIKGSVAQKHLGGGTYGDKYLNIYYTEGEMNCDNVNE